MCSAIESALQGSIYSLNEAGAVALLKSLTKMEERVTALRSSGRLTADTLRRYYGLKRFEQVAESNAIEGSTLSVGETELAIVKGVTLTGHDPGYVRDAIALDRALTRLVELAHENQPTGVSQVKELHELILEGRPSAGHFRSVPVSIKGSQHRPPKTWREVMDAMESWAGWSAHQDSLPSPLRAAVLHAWLAHIHPFVDGNGRTARAVTNLELVRSGYPPAIIRKRQDRDRYIDALQASDLAGDIGPFLDLMLERIEAALIGLEGAAREIEGYDPATAILRNAQNRKLTVWNRSVELLYAHLVDRLGALVESAGGGLYSEVFSDALSLDEYIQLCQGHPVTRSWAFRVVCNVPGLPSVERLAWVGYRSSQMRARVSASEQLAPSLFWSKRNPGGFPPWVLADSDAPALREVSITPTVGDEWHVITTDGDHQIFSTTQVAGQLTEGFAKLLAQ